MDIKKVLDIPNWYWKELPYTRRLFMDFLPFKFFYRKFPDLIVQSQFCFLYSMKRKDYIGDITKVYNQIPKDKSMIYLELEKGINLKIFILLFNIKHLRDIFKVFKSASFNKKIFLWFHYLQLLQLNDVLKNWNIQFLITHADMQPIENYITQYFKNKNIDTITLQHGLYIDYSKLQNKNIVNYENVVSKYFLAWGNDTKNLINKYHHDVDVFICGKINRHNNSEINDSDKNYFTVIFDQQMFFEYNKQLLLIAQKLSNELKLELNIRFHPANIESNYDISGNNLINMAVTNSKFVIGHSSSMLFEIMTYGIPVYKLKSDIPTNSIQSSLIFKNYEDLILKIKNSEHFDFKTESEKYIDSFGEKSEEKYKNFFHSLKENFYFI